VFNWFNKQKYTRLDLGTDMHSHLLPNLDDGVRSFEQTEEIVRVFLDLGYTKLITTPHVMSDTYRNTTAGIQARLGELRTYLKSKNLDITIEAAAEYYLDEELVRKVEQGEPLLTFGHNYVLFETNFLTEPMNLKEFIFLASTKGYKLVLAHPERYLYLQQNMKKMEDLLTRGVLFQVNISSFTGYYSKMVQTTVNKMIDNKWIHLLGSDCHHIQHAKLIETALPMKYFQKALSFPLLNKTL
jgi:tyrosine-protein phosphatase YwqE